jgi:hemolysin III
MNTTIDSLLMRPAGEADYGTRGLMEWNPPEAASTPPEVEELANSLTHGLGTALSLAGLYGLSHATGGAGATAGAVGCWVYGVTLVTAYAASTFYHSWTRGRMKRVLLLADHVAIYGLIAGTCTPFVTAPADGHGGWWTLAVVWGLALAGCVAKVARVDRLDEDSAFIYVAVALAAIACVGRLVVDLPTAWAAWFAAGLAFYLTGLVFFARGDRPFNHTIWHLFVMAGSVCHYCVVIGYVTPLAS